VVSYEKDKKAEIEVRQDYWGPKPKVKRVILLVFATDEALLEALKKGEIDYAKLTTAQASVPSNFLVKKLDEPRVVGLFFNFAAKTLDGKENPLLKPKVRQAIQLSLDQNQIIREATVSGRPVNQFLTKSVVGHNPKLPTLERNLKKAADLLKEENLADLTFSIYTTADRQAVAAALVSSLKDVGISADVKVEPNFRTLVGKLPSGEPPVFIAEPQASDGGEYIGAILTTDGEQNILSYSNQEVDKLITDSAKNFNPKERRTLIEDAVTKLMQELPIIPLFSITNTFVIKDSFDFSVNAFSDLHIEEISGREVRSTQ
jgi:ABC-type transport system substrate-binding protein